MTACVDLSDIYNKNLVSFSVIINYTMSIILLNK